MAEEQEQPCEGWEQIAKVFNVSTGSVRRRKKDLLDAGVVWKKLKTYDKPPRRWVYCAFPSALKKFVMNRGYF